MGALKRFNATTQTWELVGSSISPMKPVNPTTGDLWIDQDSDDPIDLFEQDTAPTNPVTGDLWVDTSTPSVGYSGLVNLTNAPADYLLKVGETAFVDYTSATTVLLNIKTEEGLYEMTISNTLILTSTATGGEVCIHPNNLTTYTNEMTALEIFVRRTVGSPTISSQWLTNHMFICGGNAVHFAKSEISTFTNRKTIYSHSQGILNDTPAFSFENCHGVWANTTTPWYSLGTLNFVQAQSGKVIVRRIA